MIPTYADRRKKRHERVRKSIFGTAERPRLSVFRSGKHLYAQAIDDYQAKTLFSFATTSEKFRKTLAKPWTVEGAKKLGEIFGTELLAKGIKNIVLQFQRSYCMNNI